MKRERQLGRLRLLLPQNFSTLGIFLSQQVHLRLSLINGLLREVADKECCWSQPLYRCHGLDRLFAIGRNHSSDNNPFDNTLEVLPFMNCAKAVACFIVFYVHFGRCTCGSWKDYEVLPGVTGHRQLEPEILERI